MHSVPFDGRVGVLDGVFVIEINHNPNLDVGAEDKVLGDEVCRRLLGPLRAKFEARNGAPAPQAGLTSEAMTLPTRHADRRAPSRCTTPWQARVIDRVFAPGLPFLTTS